MHVHLPPKGVSLLVTLEKPKWSQGMKLKKMNWKHLKGCAWNIWNKICQKQTFDCKAEHISLFSSIASNNILRKRLCIYLVYTGDLRVEEIVARLSGLDLLSAFFFFYEPFHVWWWKRIAWLQGGLLGTSLIPNAFFVHNIVQWTSTNTVSSRNRCLSTIINALY